MSRENLMNVVNASMKRGESLVLVLRGLPGSGKSTLVDMLAERFGGAMAVVSADKFPGLYSGKGIVPDKIPLAHHTCLRQFLSWLDGSWNTEDEPAPGLMVVDNTNIEAWEVAKYVETAQAFGVRTLVVNIVGRPSVAFERQSHGVPFDAYCSMVARYQGAMLPPWWASLEVPMD